MRTIPGETYCRDAIRCRYEVLFGMCGVFNLEGNSLSVLQEKVKSKTEGGKILDKRLRVISMGAGVQTTAMLLRYYKEYDYCIFADTGDEMPGTYYYIEKYLKPFCKKVGVPWITVKHKKYNSIMEWCMNKKVLPIKRTRNCTVHFKIKPINRFLKAHGATRLNPAVIDIGFSLDESHRLGNNRFDPQYIKKNYPLLDDKITRQQCQEIIREHGWELPVKSGCDFCPFKSRKTIRALAYENPERFAKIVAMEKNDKTYPRNTLLDSGPLESILNNAHLDAYLDEDVGTCDDGHCFT